MISSCWPNYVQNQIKITFISNLALISIYKNHLPSIYLLFGGVYYKKLKFLLFAGCAVAIRKWGIPTEHGANVQPVFLSNLPTGCAVTASTTAGTTHS